MCNGASLIIRCGEVGTGRKMVTTGLVISDAAPLTLSLSFFGKGLMSFERYQVLAEGRAECDIRKCESMLLVFFQYVVSLKALIVRDAVANTYAEDLRHEQHRRNLEREAG